MLPQVLYLSLLSNRNFPMPSKWGLIISNITPTDLSKCERIEIIKQSFTKSKNGPDSLLFLRLFKRFDVLQYFNMINHSQGGIPRLLMQFSRNQEVPKLVSVHQIVQKENNRNKLLMQARTQATHQSRKQEPDITVLRHTLEGQRTENEQLRMAVKQLTLQLQKLKQVNQGLLVRIKEVQSSYRALRKDLERNGQEQRKNAKIAIYNEIQQYIRVAVERLTLSLKQEKMNPMLEDKLERFMAEIMQINSVSVEQLVRKTRQQDNKRVDSRVQPSSRRKDSRKVERYHTDLSSSKNTIAGREQYATIMQRLTGQTKMSKSFAGGGFNSVSQDARLRTVYATTPQKRRKIFD